MNIETTVEINYYDPFILKKMREANYEFRKKLLLEENRLTDAIDLAIAHHRVDDVTYLIGKIPIRFPKKQDN